VSTGPATNAAPVRERTDVPPARRGHDDTTVTDGRPVIAVPERKVGDVPVRDDRKPRSSLLATLGLIFSVASALLVLSGPLLGYGIGLAVLALILSLGGISATGSRHVSGKTDALIGMVLSLGAIVVGVLALTGSLSWLGTDMHPVTSLRHWLDTQTVNRF
jgi:hypothetical protein